MLQFALEHGPAVGHVLLPLLPLEPLADLGPGLVALGQLHPVPAGAFGVLGGDDLHNLPGLKLVVKAHDAAVDLGPGHGVAHGGVDGVGKVDGGGPGGEVDDLRVGGKDENLVGEEVHLQTADELPGLGVLLVLQQAADPGEGVLGAQFLVLQALLVLPVGRHAVLGHVVHLPGADLHLEGDALLTDDGGVEGLVHVGLGGSDVILKPAQDHFIHVVDAPQDAVAGGNVVHDDPEGVEVKDLAELLVLGVHLPVDGVDVLHPAIDGALDALLFQAGGDLLLDVFHEGGVGSGLAGQLVGDVPIGHGVQVHEGLVLHLPLHPLHAQAVGDGGVDLQGLQGLFPLLAFALVLQGADVVHPVADLNEDHPHILGHGHKHLAQVLHLLLLGGGEVHFGQLGDPLHQVGHGGAEAFGHLLMGGLGVLDGVVEEGRHDGVAVQPQFGHQVGHLQGVGDVGGAVFPQLPLVAVPGEFKGRPDPCPLLGGAVLLDLLVQFLVPGLQFDEGVRRFLRRLLGLCRRE